MVGGMEKSGQKWETHHLQPTVELQSQKNMDAHAKLSIVLTYKCIQLLYLYADWSESILS